MTSSTAPEITVLYFAAASTATGLSAERVPLPIAANHAVLPTDQGERARFPLTRLAALLAARHPGTALANVLGTSSWAVDLEMVDDPDTVFLRGGEEVAVICPVSGG